MNNIKTINPKIALLQCATSKNSSTTQDTKNNLFFRV